MSDSLILIAVENRVNAQLLQETLKQYHNVKVLEADATIIYPFALGIFDGITLKRFQDQIIARKEAENDVFLPTLLVTPRQDISLVTRQLWKSIDEVIFAPIEKIELLARVEVLLRSHSYSVELALLYKNAHESATLDERQRLARELHDTVTQMIFSASALAQTLPRLQEIDAEKARLRLDEVIQLNQESLIEMRRLLLEMRPSNLVRTPLQDLFNQLAVAAQNRNSIKVTATVQGLTILPEEIHMALYRIVQESLNNVVKHSQAMEAHINLSIEDGQLILKIRDNGKGFNTENQSQGFGLGGIQERVALIKGTLTVTSHEGGGTEIIVLQPIPQNLAIDSTPKL